MTWSGSQSRWAVVSPCTGFEAGPTQLAAVDARLMGLVAAETPVGELARQGDKGIGVSWERLSDFRGATARSSVRTLGDQVGTDSDDLHVAGGSG